MTHSPYLIFRCDGNPSIGSGHIMRCLSIAEAAREAGYRCLFVTADSTFTDIIKNKNHDNIILNSNYQSMMRELPTLLPAIQNHCSRAMFVDSYYVTPQYLNTLHEMLHSIGSKLIYIDDVLTFGYTCDILLNYNIYGPDKKEEYQTLYKSCNMTFPRLLLGPSYAPLRSEFQHLPARTVRRQAEHILISTGGADAEHMGIGIAKAIMQREKKLRAYHFHFVVGHMNQDADKLKALTVSAPNIMLHFDVADMCSLMRKMDVAISAAGSTLYELCAVQTPTITYVLADNQVPGAEGFCHHRVMTNAGDVRDSSSLELAGKLLDEATKLSEDYDRRVLLASNMGKIVDGNGARRVIQEVL